MIAGQQTATTISIVPHNAFNQTVQLSVSGTVSGVTVNFQPASLSVGQTSTAVIQASSQSVPQSLNLTINGASGPLSSSTTVNLAVVGSPTQTAALFDHIYVDGFIHDMVYDPVHKLVYAANPPLNEVEVISPKIHSVVSTILIPQATVLDVTPDGNTLWVGTTGDYLYSVDTATLRVTSIVAPNPIGVNSLSTIRALSTTANGSLLLRMGEFNVTAEGLVQYIPSTGQFKDRSNEAFAERLFRSADGTKVLLGAGGALIVYDSASDSFETDFSMGGSPLAAISPDGSQFAMRIGSNLSFFNSQLQQIASLSNLAIAGSPVYSRDGKHVYFPQDISILRPSPTFTSVNTQSFAVEGLFSDIFYLPNAPVNCIGGDVCDQVPWGTTIRASDETGILMGPTPFGLGFVDPSRTVATPSDFSQFNVNFPNYDAMPGDGPSDFNTAVTLLGGNLQPGAAVFFGQDQAAVIGGSQDQSQLQVIAPVSSAMGPVNVRASFANGWSAVAPLGYSFGPSIQYFLPMGTASTVGDRITIFGYGFGQDASKITVKIGGASATVIGSSYYGQGLQLPLYQLAATIPPGTPGAADLTITTPSGSYTIPSGFHYLQSVATYAVGNNFTQILFDGTRNRLFLLDPIARQVRMVDPGSGVVVASFPTGVQPKDMTFTVDASVLVTANFGDGTLSLIDPSKPNVSTVVSAAITGDTNGVAPQKLAATSTGKIMVAYGAASSTATSVQLFDLSSHSLTPVSIVGDCGFGFAGLVSVQQGARIFVAAEGNSGGGVCTYDSSTNTFANQRDLQDFLVDPTASSDGHHFVVNDQYILDDFMKVAGQISVPDLIAANSPGAVFGTLLHQNGGLMYLPLVNGLQIYDVPHARLLRSYSGMNLSTAASRTVAIDADGKTVYAISPTGLQIAVLDSVPLSIGHVDLQNAAPPSAGLVLTVKGSGFERGATVLLNGVGSTTAFLDSNTLRIALSTIQSGSYEVSVVNPSGERFDLGLALVVN